MRKSSDIESPYTNEPYLSLGQCIHGHLYKIRSRNLSHGVYNQKDKGFIGIRTKFGDRYLFTELHWDSNESFGTVKPKEDLGPIPEGIPIKEALDTIDKKTGRVVDFDKPVMDGGRGWFFVDTGEASRDIFPCRKTNKVLFEYLDKIK